MNQLRLRTKYTGGNRYFKTKWEYDFLFEYKNNLASCLLCTFTTSMIKQYNIQRHFFSAHMDFHIDYPESTFARKLKVKELKGEFIEDEDFENLPILQTDAILEGSILLAYNIGRAKRPYSDGVFLKQTFMNLAQLIFPYDFNLHDIISKLKLSRPSITRRIAAIGYNLLEQLEKDLSLCRFFSIALDESIDIEGKPQLAIFVRLIMEDFTIKEELLGLIALKVSTAGEDIKKALDLVMQNSKISLNKLISVATDGAPAMIGYKTGLIGLINHDKSYPKVLPVHCIIHREALAAKYFNFESVFNIVHETIRYLRNSSKQHRQFKFFIEELNQANIPRNLPWFCLVRWLSISNVLDNFFKMFDEIKQFLALKKHIIPELTDIDWLLDFSFFNDMVQHLKALNISLQGHNKFINKLSLSIFNFQEKLVQFINDLKTGSYNYFPCLKLYLIKYKIANFSPHTYINRLKSLYFDFEHRFKDLRDSQSDFEFLENPFKCNVLNFGKTILSTFSRNDNEIEQELYKLKLDSHLKYIKQTSVSLIDFWKKVPKKKYPELQTYAMKLLSIFGTTYCCESLYSNMKFIKNCHRSRLTNEHLEELLRLALSKYRPDFKKISKEFKKYKL